jgi:hypothetical protein
MHQLQWISSFHELRRGRTTRALLVDMRDRLPADVRSRVVQYLKGGTRWGWHSPCIWYDPLDSSHVEGGLALLTDGRWVWPNTLVYFVERYAVDLPGEFLDHMAANEWAPPELDQEELARLQQH